MREVLTTLRNAAPQIPELRHPLAKCSFRAIYVDAANRGRFAQKELGMVYSRDILGEPGNLETPAPRLLEDMDNENREPTEREKEETSFCSRRLSLRVSDPPGGRGRGGRGDFAGRQRS